jgi:putative membrane protein
MSPGGCPEPPAGTDSPLRDDLAAERTRLANERTLLAYVRTGLALVIVGLTFLHFIDSGLLRAAGFAAIPAGILTVGIGAARFRRVRRSIESRRLR